MFTRLFRIKQVKALKKVRQELFTSMQTGNPKTKRVFSDLKKAKLEEIIKRVVIVYYRWERPEVL